MATFTAIQDMSKPSLILNSLQEIGHHFYQKSHAQDAAMSTPLSGLSTSEEDYEKAVGVFHPLAYYLQKVAEDKQKEKLGEMLADSKVMDQLCEGILHPFVKGNHCILGLIKPSMCLLRANTQLIMWPLNFPLTSR